MNEQEIKDWLSKADPKADALVQRQIELVNFISTLSHEEKIIVLKPLKLMKYIRKATEVKAIQFTGDNDNDFDSKFPSVFDSWIRADGTLSVVLFKCTEYLKPGDWLVCDGIHTVVYTDEQWREAGSLNE